MEALWFAFNVAVGFLTTHESGTLHKMCFLRAQSLLFKTLCGVRVRCCQLDVWYVSRDTAIQLTIPPICEPKRPYVATKHTHKPQAKG